jgi:carboxyl-terminal processing protease
MCHNGFMQDNNEQKRVKSTVRGSFLGAGLACLLAASAFFSGVHVGNGTLTNPNLEAGLFSFWSSKPAAKEEVDLSEFWKVWDLLDKKFVSSSSTADVTTQEKIEGAIEGLVRSYDDPYTVFLPPTDANMFEEDISGNFGGVGMEVGLRDEVITVIAPLPNTPAAKAGILAKDVLVKIDDTSTEGMGVDEAVRRIRGEEGSTVRLTIYRSGEPELLEIAVIRDNITIPTVDAKKVDGVFVISLYSFNAIAETKMQEALNEYVRSGAKKLVLDVRGNPGGFLQSAVSIASHFVPAGLPIVSENFGADTTDEIYRSTGRTLGDKMPEEMVVLVDGGSASASEILAGALQEHGIATLIGDQTYGKGSVQELVSLDSGSSLKVTVARWFTPKGVSISEGGLTPDVFIKRTAEQVIAGEDPQLEGAVAWLNGDKTVGTTTPIKAKKD